MKNKKWNNNLIVENPTTSAVLFLSFIVLVVGTLAIGFIWSFLIVLIIDLVYFRKYVIKLYEIIKKKLVKEKKKEENIEVLEYKVDDKIVVSGKKEDKKKKKDDKDIEDIKDKTTKGDDEMKKGSKKDKKKKKKKKHHFFQWFLLFLCFCFLAGIAVIIAFAMYIVEQAPAFEPDALYTTEPSIYYYSNGEQMAVVGTENREIINYDELPEVFINALVATEDSKFFQHNGVDIQRFLVASVKQLTGHTDAGGASTLTMQLSKNAYTSKEASGWEGIVRKFTDVYLSVFKIETTYTKEEIIEFYVNSNQLGSVYGVEAASQLYFHKSAKDMNISEAAMLAGMFQAPSGYNPYYHPEAAEKRRKTVLSLMRRHGYITEEEYQIAKKMTVEKIVKEMDSTYDTSEEIQDVDRSAVDVVTKEVIKRTGKDPRAISMKVYTTIDKNLQSFVGNIMTGKTYKWQNSKVQAGIAVVDVKTGALVAVGGNRENTKNGNLNHATDIHYQIGSTAKPLYDYGPAIEYLNWSTATILADEPITYSDGTSISNFDGKFNGYQTLRTQLKYSRNIPALKAYQSVDKSKIYSFVTSLGLHPGNDMYEPHAIGGYDGENPLSMASAYAAFANGGYYTEPYTVTKIVEVNTGETQITRPNTKQVMQSSTAYMISSVLKDAGEYTIGKIKNKPFAAKTGTANFDRATVKAHKLPSKAVNHFWVVGYNTEYSIGLWYGYDSVKDGHNMFGTTYHTKLFKTLAQGIFKSSSNFTKPDTVVEVEVEKDNATLMLPSSNTPKDYKMKELFVVGTEPTEVSPRFDTLPDVTNLNATSYGGIINVSWTPIATPDAFNFDVLKQQNSSAYRRDDKLTAYVNSLIKKNKSVLGTLGYNVYVVNSDGTKTLVGWTDTNQINISGYYGNVTIMVSSCYSTFKASMSPGKTVSVYNGGGYIPTDPGDGY